MSVAVDRPTALGASFVLHAIVLGFGFVAAYFFAGGEEVRITPVSLIGPEIAGTPAFAEKADEPEMAMTENPLEDLPPTPVGEDPNPRPESPPSPNQSTRAAAPPRQAPSAAPTKAETRTQSNFDFDSLSDELTSTRAGGQQRSGGQRGPSQLSRDLEQSLSEGQARAQTDNALRIILDRIGDAWNVSCATAEDRNVVVRLRMNLSREGGLESVRLEDYPNVDAINDPRIRAAAISALSAARAAAPFAGLPEQTYSDWRSRRYVFPASDICAERMG